MKNQEREVYAQATSKEAMITVEIFEGESIPSWDDLLELFKMINDGPSSFFLHEDTGTRA